MSDLPNRFHLSRDDVSPDDIDSSIILRSHVLKSHSLIFKGGGEAPWGPCLCAGRNREGWECRKGEEKGERICVCVCARCHTQYAARAK